jgi:23S rRNA pseudouridine2457 synthase
MNFTVILFNKPYGVLSRFTPEGKWESLALYGPFPPGVYPAGRLDAESEGLLVLTDHPGLQHCLTDPRFSHPRTYLAQVEGIPDERALHRLEEGVIIEGKRTRPATARMLNREPDLPPRPVPIRKRKGIPTAWIELTLTEGRNRQVRKMTAAVGYPTLRLVRIRIETLDVKGLNPGGARTLDREARERLLVRLNIGKSTKAPGLPQPGRSKRA